MDSYLGQKQPGGGASEERRGEERRRKEHGTEGEREGKAGPPMDVQGRGKKRARIHSLPAICTYVRTQEEARRRASCIPPARARPTSWLELLAHGINRWAVRWRSIMDWNVAS